MNTQLTAKGAEGISTKTLKDGRKTFSILGLGCVVFFLVSSIL